MVNLKKRRFKMKKNLLIKLLLVSGFCIPCCVFLYMHDNKKPASENRGEAWDALQFLTVSRAFPGMDIPQDGYSKAFQFYNDHFKGPNNRQTAFAFSAWQNIGPNNIGGR